MSQGKKRNDIPKNKVYCPECMAEIIEGYYVQEGKKKQIRCWNCESFFFVSRNEWMFISEGPITKKVKKTVEQPAEKPVKYEKPVVHLSNPIVETIVEQQGFFPFYKDVPVSRHHQVSYGS